MNTCETCKAFDPDKNFCRLRAPVFHPDLLGGAFPSVLPVDWCLDWRAKERAVTAKTKRGSRPISDEDKPTDKHREFAKSLGIDVGPEWGKFKNYCLAHDKRYANFEAAFRNWLASPLNQHGGKR